MLTRRDFLRTSALAAAGM
ncbi:MAG: twin-arginine translocation signal domain-containing protein, partial [Terriglobia bacterium]